MLPTAMIAVNMKAQDWEVVVMALGLVSYRLAKPLIEAIDGQCQRAVDTANAADNDAAEQRGREKEREMWVARDRVATSKLAEGIRQAYNRGLAEGTRKGPNATAAVAPKKRRGRPRGTLNRKTVAARKTAAKQPPVATPVTPLA